MSIRYITSIDTPDRKSLSGRVLSQVRREFGAEVEPFTLHLPVPELLAGSWMACRETLLAGDGSRNAKELVAAAVSTINRCPYCVDAHSIMLQESSGLDYTEALTAPYLKEVAAWAMATRSPGSPILLAPPFSQIEAPAFIGTAVFFHYINRMVTILLGASPLPFSSGLAKKVSLHIAAWFFGGAIRLEKIPGESVDLLPKAELPEDLSWAKTSPAIAGAFARFAKSIEQAGTTSLSDNVRASVKKTLSNWNGSDPEMHTEWLEEALAELQEGEKAVAKLALLTALAPYRVDVKTVRGFSMHFPGDKRLISALAWSSFTASRKIGSWL